MKALTRLGKWFGWGRFVALLLLIVFVQLRASGNVFLESMQLRSFDLYQWMKPREATARPVLIIDVDEASIAKYGQWPWPRTRIAQIVENATKNGAKAIGFDMVFSEPDRLNPALVAQRLTSLGEAERQALMKLPANDQIFSDAIKRSQVVLGRSGVNAAQQSNKQNGAWPQTSIATIGRDPRPYLHSYSGVLHNIEMLETAAAGRGLFSLSADFGGTIRRVPLIQSTQSTLAPSLSIELLRIASASNTIVVRTADLGVQNVIVGSHVVPTDQRARFWVHFSKHDRARYISALDVIEDTAAAKRLNGKLALVGTSAVGLFDLRSTPVDPAMPGVEIHAQVIENILSKTFLQRPANAVGGELLLAVLVGLGVIILVPILGALRVLVLGLAVAAALVSLSWYAYKAHGMLVDVAYPLSSSLVIFLALLFINYFREETERRQIRGAFSQYLSPTMVEQLANDPSRLVLGGETRNLTLLFSDIRGFTSISETYLDNPQDLTALINRLLTPLSNAIIDARGTIDKYIGDAIVAFWNAPLDDERHAENACTAALNMLSRLDELNAERESEARIVNTDIVPLRIGIGINTGDCVVGNVGSEMRFDYSVLGDTVNLCARLEDQTKTYGLPIIVGQSTQQLVHDKFAFLEIDRVRVAGKSKPTIVFTLLGDETVLRSPEFAAMRTCFSQLLAAFRAQDWVRAQTFLADCRSCGDAFNLDTLFDQYENRIREFAIEPPAEDWDGVISLSKN